MFKAKGLLRTVVLFVFSDFKRVAFRLKKKVHCDKCFLLIPRHLNKSSNWLNSTRKSVTPWITAGLLQWVWYCCHTVRHDGLPLADTGNDLTWHSQRQGRRKCVGLWRLGDSYQQFWSFSACNTCTILESWKHSLEVFVGDHLVWPSIWSSVIANTRSAVALLSQILKISKDRDASLGSCSSAASHS